MVCQPSHAARSVGSSAGDDRIREISSMFLQVSGFDASAHHLPLP